MTLEKESEDVHYCAAHKYTFSINYNTETDNAHNPFNVNIKLYVHYTMMQD